MSMNLHQALAAARRDNLEFKAVQWAPSTWLYLDEEGDARRVRNDEVVKFTAHALILEWETRRRAMSVVPGSIRATDLQAARL